MPRQAEDLTGKVFGTRKVIKRAKSRDYAGYKTIYWRVQCLACGHKTEVQGGSLRRGAGCGPCTSGKPAAPAGRGRRVKRPPPAGKQ